MRGLTAVLGRLLQALLVGRLREAAVDMAGVRLSTGSLSRPPPTLPRHRHALDVVGVQWVRAAATHHIGHVALSATPARRIGHVALLGPPAALLSHV